MTSLAGLTLGSFAAGAALPDPDLIIGAGHGTHLAMLAARRARGGKTVVLMKPSLPTAWFDLCLIPEHDNPPAAGNILKTQGPLNTVAPAATRDPDRGILLLGGPSRRHGWDEEGLLGQIRRITDAGSGDWYLADSARTPETTRRRLGLIRRHNIEYLPFSETGRERLERALATSARAWVSEDSMSMIYEALTAGAAVGILSLPLRRRDRISEAVRRLAEQGWVTPYRDWREGADLRPLPAPLDEAGRCARLVIETLGAESAAVR